MFWTTPVEIIIVGMVICTPIFQDGHLATRKNIDQTRNFLDVQLLRLQKSGAWMKEVLILDKLQPYGIAEGKALLVSNVVSDVKLLPQAQIQLECEKLDHQKQDTSENIVLFARDVVKLLPQAQHQAGKSMNQENGQELLPGSTSQPRVEILPGNTSQSMVREAQESLRKTKEVLKKDQQVIGEHPGTQEDHNFFIKGQKDEMPKKEGQEMR
jgi:hypothetical protein